MVDNTVVSNGHVTWLAGPDSAISESSWNDGPSLSELQSLANFSAGIKIDGTDFANEASEQVEDRSFADQAGAQARGAVNASGSIEVYTPGEGDTTSIHAQTYETFATPRSRLALVQRLIAPQGEPIAAGDEINVYRVETDSRSHNRNDASRTVGTGMNFQGTALIGYIVPSESATKPTPSVTTLAPAVDGIEFLEVEYEGRNVTVGATYISSNESVATVTPGGVVVGVGTGAATISIQVPGASGAASVEVTVD
ncbi:MAG: hypothetical protein ACTH32_06325 [Microbacterium gubbeenense]|uniref:phage tail tube protein n=1 Tax=Microbacterium gubbeenense TaxID=159896 RepID=UPI003F97F6D1